MSISAVTSLSSLLGCRQQAQWAISSAAVSAVYLVFLTISARTIISKSTKPFSPNFEG